MKKKKYCVFVSMTGLIEVEAENEDEAESIANLMSTDDVSWSDNWAIDNVQDADE